MIYIKQHIATLSIIIFSCFNAFVNNAQQEQDVIQSNELKLDVEDRYKQLADTLFTGRDIQWLFEFKDSNNKLKMERLASYYFHQKINSYRKTRRLKTLYWEDRLWIAARNHNVYLGEIGTLTHRQNEGKSFFSGVTPNDRVNYVAFDNEISFVGENCCQFSTSFSDWNTLTEDQISEIAYNIATDAFEIWRKSSGHHQNMIQNEYFFHGTSFIVLSNGNVYGTSKFAGNVKSFVKNEISYNLDNPEHNKVAKSFIIDGKEYDGKPLTLEDQERKLFSVLTHAMGRNQKRLSSELYQAANKYQKDLIDNKVKDVSLKKRYFKETGFFARFDLIGKSIENISLKVYFDKEETLNNVAEKKLEFILKERVKQIKRRQQWGGAVTLIEEGDKMVCYVDVFFIVKKK